MMPETRKRLLRAVDRFHPKQAAKALRILAADTPTGVEARGLIQMLTGSPEELSGEELRTVFAGRLAELEYAPVTDPSCSCGGELIDVDRQPHGQAQMVLACKPAKVWAKCAECGKRVTVLASLRWSLRGPS